MELTQGLMAKIEPRPEPTGGYLGRRTAPMLLHDGQQVWLLWERKADHRGSTSSVTGDLISRAIHERRWQPPVILGRGQIDYHLVHPAQSMDSVPPLKTERRRRS